MRYNVLITDLHLTRRARAFGSRRKPVRLARATSCHYPAFERGGHDLDLDGRQGSGRRTTGPGACAQGFANSDHVRKDALKERFVLATLATLALFVSMPLLAEQPVGVPAGMSPL